MAERDYQTDVRTRIYDAWREHENVMPVLPTGGGKTFVFTKIAADYDGSSVLVAHRQELVSQAALALNRARIPHSIIAQKDTIREIVALEHETHGHSSYNVHGKCRVASVDTLKGREEKWFDRIGIVVIDEGHHVLRDNKWGTTRAKFQNAKGLFPTAHGMRADNKGLGRRSHGLVDHLVVGPCGSDLMGRGYLTRYRLAIVKNDLDFSDVGISPTTGDYVLPKLRAATHKSKKIIGDIVSNYLKYAPGEAGITFAVDVEGANKIAAEYRKRDVPAEVITANTDIRVRGKYMRDLAAKKLLQLVSVDCLGEGVDVPGIGVVTLARRTASWQVYSQQIGRLLRVMVAEEFAKCWDRYTDADRLAIIAASNKPRGMLIDQVGNFAWHYERRGLPESRQDYSLDPGESEASRRSDAIPLTVCEACEQPYHRYLVICPYCGAERTRAGRGSPEMVDGEVVLIDPALLAATEERIKQIDGPALIPDSVRSADIARGMMRQHHERAVQQHSLRSAMGVWGGWQKQQGLSDADIQRLFYLRYGVDVMTVQTWGRAEAKKIEDRIRTDLTNAGVIV